MQCWGKYTGFSFGTSAYSQIDSGSDYSCARRSSDNTLFCSGANRPAINTTVAYANFSTGFLHTCALTLSGSFLDCAGDNSQGQAPAITLNPASIPLYLPMDRAWTQDFTIAGGAAPAVLSLDTGPLPTGIQLNGNTLAGVPTVTGLFTFTLQADETYANSSLPHQLQPRKIAYSTTVEDATTMASYSVTPPSTPAGSPVTVDVLVAKTGTPTLTGSVVISGTTSTNVYEAGCTGSVDTAGNAQCVLFFPTSGDKTITAKYAGSSYYFASPETSTSVNITPLVIVPANSAGSGFNCSLNANGALYCWGKNDSDQTTPPGGVYNVVSAGRSHACARALNGQIYCWGWNGYGVSNPPALSGFTTVTSGATHACGLIYDGSVRCWGNQLSGRTSPPAGVIFRQISAGDDHTCGLDAGGAASCWGVSSYNRTTPVGGPFSKISSGGVFTCGIQSSDGSLSCWGLITNPPTGTGFKDLDSGYAHACAIASDDTVTCWGNNTSNQANPPGGTFRSVSAGSTHTCGIRTDGFMLCWGDNTYNQAPVLGILPVSLPTIDVDTFWNQALVVSGGRETPPAYVFNTLGNIPTGLDVDSNTGEISGTPSQAGHYTYTVQVVERNLTPALVQERSYVQTVRSAVNVLITDVSPTDGMVGKPVQVSVTVSETPGGRMNAHPSETVTINADDCTTCSFTMAGGSGSCFLYFQSSGDKALSASYAGDANFLPGTTSAPTAVQVNEFTQEPTLYTGQNRTLIHRADGSLTCLGSGCPASNRTYGLSIAWVYPAAGVGDALICVLQTDGQVRCEPDGQPAVVHAGQYTALSVGAAHACAIDVAGAISCWGDDSSGQSTPQAGPFIAVSAGQTHTCAIQTDGSLQCWGSVPGTPPPGIFTTFSAGANHTCAVSAGGSISCWGDNSAGQSSPPAGIQFQAVSVGEWHTCGVLQDGSLTC